MKANDGKVNPEEPKELRMWKKAYIKASIEALRPFGDVLQVGFDFGSAANRIQEANPKNHIIIESDPKVATAAQAWAMALGRNILVINDTWQNALPALNVFDAIYFNDDADSGDIDMMRFFNPHELKETSNHAKELLKGLESMMSEVKVHYTDQQIDVFCHDIGKHNLNQLPIFFETLKKNGHITLEQYERVMKQYLHERGHKGKTSDESLAPSPLLRFLQDCLKTHMRKGSRFSGYISTPVSKYEDPLFFESIITNPGVDYKEESVKFDVPGFKANSAILMVVEKVA